MTLAKHPNDDGNCESVHGVVDCTDDGGTDSTHVWEYFGDKLHEFLQFL